MAAAAIPIISAIAGPLLGKLFGGKEPRLPQELESELINWFHQAGSEAEGLRSMSADLRNRFLAELKHRSDEGIGSPEFNIAVGESLNPNARPTQEGNRQRQKALEEQRGGMRKADDIYGEVSQGIDQYGQGINATGDSIGSEVQGTFDRSAGRADQTSHEAVANIGNTFGGAIKATSGAYQGFGGDTAGTYGGVRDMSGKAYDETGKLIETMDPSGMAAQARASRSFEPAMASMAMRLRKMGVDPGSPEFNAAMATVESDRARAMDDASIGERDKYISAKGQNILGKSEKLGGLDLANLKERVRLGESEAEILRGLGLKQGDEFGKELIRNMQVQNQLDDTRSVRSIENQNKTQERSKDYWDKKINAPLIQSDLQHKDLATDTELANRGDKTAATNYAIDKDIQQSGTQFHTNDLNYRNQGWNDIYNVSRNMTDDAARLKQEGLNSVNTAYASPEQTPGPNWAGTIAGAGIAGANAWANWNNNNVTSQGGISDKDYGKVKTQLDPPISLPPNPGYTPPPMPTQIRVKAAGGPVNPNEAYVVGEKGPEVFTPKQPGQITANPASVPQTGQQSIQKNNPWATQMSQRFNPPAAPPAPAPATPPQNTNPNTVPGGPAPVSNYGPVNVQGINRGVYPEQGYNPTTQQRESMRGAGVPPPSDPWAYRGAEARVPTDAAGRPAPEMDPYAHSATGGSSYGPVQGDPRLAADQVAKQLRTQGLGAPDPRTMPQDMNGMYDKFKNQPTYNLNTKQMEYPGGRGESSYGPASRTSGEAMQDIQNFRGKLEGEQLAPKGGDPNRLDDRNRGAAEMDYTDSMREKFKGQPVYNLNTKQMEGGPAGPPDASGVRPIDNPNPQAASMQIQQQYGARNDAGIMPSPDNPMAQRQREQMMRRRNMQQQRQLQMEMNRRRPPMQRQGPMPNQGYGRY